MLLKCAFISITCFLYGIFAHMKITDVTDCPKFNPQFSGFYLETSFSDEAFGMNLTTPFVLDELLKVKIIVDTKKGDKWIPTGFQMNDNFCSAVDNFKAVWARALKEMKLSDPCPIPEGSYTVSKLTANSDETGGLEFNYDAEYKIFTLFTRYDKNVICRYVHVTMSPDPPPKE